MTIFNYTVNYIDLIIVGIVVLFAIVGSFRGIALTIVNFMRYAIGLPLCFFASSYASQPIYDTYLKKPAYDWVNSTISIDTEMDEIISRMNESLANVPELIRDSLNMNPDALLKLGSAEEITAYVTDTIIQPVALIAVKIAVFVTVFLVFFGITGLIVTLVRKHNKRKRNEKNKSTLKDIDRIIGCIFGILKGLVIAFAFVGIVNLFICNWDYSSSEFLSNANDSILFNSIVKFNPFNFITEGII